ncbi:MAG: F0F1 ATP synthase subunit epsilon [Alphaproteobacteria bacterium]
MQLKVFLPTQILVDEPCSKVVAEDAKGLFCLLPKHIDYVSEIAPSVVSYVDDNGNEKFIATDKGVLTKQGNEVRICTARGFVSNNIDDINKKMKEEFLVANEADEYKEAQNALARLEIGIMRHLMTLGGK